MLPPVPRIFRKPVLLALAGCVLAGPVRAAGAWAEFEQPRAAQPDGLRLELSLPKDHFFQGEEIPATLTFSNKTGRTFQILDGKYRPGGRPGDLTFLAKDASGTPVADLPSWYYGRSRFWNNKEGSPTGEPVALQTWSITVPVNDWVRFSRPGVYTLVVRSDRVRDGSSPKSAVPLVSNEVTIHIDPLTAEREQSVIETARRFIVPHRDKAARFSPIPLSVRDETLSAARQLSYVQTPAALAEIIPLLEENDEAGRAAARALDRVANPKEAAAQLLAAIEEGHPMPGLFNAEVYAALETADITEGILNLHLVGNPSPLEKAVASAKQKLLDAARTASGGKGPVYAAALWIALQDDRENTALLAEFTAHQLELPPNQCRDLISRWSSELTGDMPLPRLGGPHLLPLLRQAASAPNYDPYALEVLAKVRPADARPLIIEDIERPQSLFLAKERIHFPTPVGLNALPGEPIPELTETFREKLSRTDWEIGHLLPLVDRYGTADLLPDVRRFYQSKAGNWECFVEVACLRFLIRHSPQEGIAALRASLHSRQLTACYKNLLAEVFTDLWDPSALPVIEPALSDPDPEVVISAGKILRDHGSAETMEPLLAALERLRAQTLAQNGVAYWSSSLAQSLLKSTRLSWSEVQRKRLESIAHAPQ